MKPSNKLLFVTLFILFSGASLLEAQASSELPVYPGKMWYSSGTARTAWLISTGLEETATEPSQGEELRITWGLGPLADLGGFIFGIDGFYRAVSALQDSSWLTPGLGLWAGWQFNISRNFTLDIQAGGEMTAGRRVYEVELDPGTTVDTSLIDTNLQVNADFRIGVDITFRVFENLYLTLGPGFIQPLTESRPSLFVLQGGLRYASPHRIPLDEVNPRLKVAPSQLQLIKGLPDGTALILPSLGRSAGVTAWSIEIRDQSSRVIKTWDGKGIPPDQLLWDGIAADGTIPGPFEKYNIVLMVKDSHDMKSEASGVLSFSVKPEELDGTLGFSMGNLVFPETLSGNDEESTLFLKNNRSRLEGLAAFLNTFPGHVIRLESHMNPHWKSGAKEFQDEQSKILLPQSRKRAELLRQVLVKLNLDPRSIEASGAGGLFPLVAWDSPDSKNNTRIEFRLAKIK